VDNNERFYPLIELKAQAAFVDGHREMAVRGDGQRLNAIGVVGVPFAFSFP